VGAAAGEDLALVTGRGQPDLTGLEGRRPYFRDIDVAVLGIRPQDEYRVELQAAGIAYRAVPELRSDGAARSAQWARGVLQDCDGFWVHVDVDVLDPAVMPAVDAPDPGGIAYAELELLLAGLVSTPRCLGVEITVFDPDYDPDGRHAAEIVDLLVAGLTPVRAGTPDPTQGRRAKAPASRTAAPFADFAPGPRRSPEAGAAGESADASTEPADPPVADEAPGPADRAGDGGRGPAEPAVPGRGRRPAGSRIDREPAIVVPPQTRSGALRRPAGQSSAEPAAEEAPPRRAPVVDHGPGKLRRRAPQDD
jgi:arginase